MLKPINSTLAGIKESPIRTFMQLAKTIPDCCSLTIGEPDFRTPEPIKSAGINALTNNHTNYPPFNGREDLKTELSKFVTGKYNFNYASDEILVTSGATEGIFATLFALLNPDDEIIIPAPAFGLYANIAKLCRAKVITLDTCPDNFQIAAEKLSAAVSAKTKAIIVTSPNNPTGTVYDKTSIDNIAESAKKHGYYIICDEVYRDIAYTDAEYISNRLDLRQQLIVIQSFSKPWAMTGWRIGYLCVDKSLFRAVAVTHQNMITSAANFTQDAAIAALSFKPDVMCETYRQRRNYVTAELKAMGFNIIMPAGAFYVFPRIKDIADMDSDNFCLNLLQKYKLAVVPGTAFGAEGYFRISYCYSQDDLVTGMQRLKNYVTELKNYRD